MPSTIGSLTGPKVIQIIATRVLSAERDGVKAEAGDAVDVAPVRAAALVYTHRALYASTAAGSRVTGSRGLARPARRRATTRRPSSTDKTEP